MSDIRWGILGTSGIATDKFIPALHAARGARAVAVASRTAERGSAIADEFEIPRSTDYEALIDADDIDAIYVTLPNTMHAEWVTKALRAGKGVLCEKPMVTTAAEAEQVAAVSAETGLPVMEGLMYRFHPQNRRAMALVADGAIGEVREVRVHNAFRLVDNLKADNIRLTDGLGAGALMDMGCYVVSATRMCFGSEPIAARGWVDNDAATNVDFGFAGTLEYSDRRFAQISWSFRSGYGAGYSVMGTEGTIEVPRAFIPGAVGQLTVTQVIRIGRASERTIEEIVPADHFVLEIEEFSSAIAQQRPPRYTVADAVAQARALDLVRSSWVEP